MKRYITYLYSKLNKSLHLQVAGASLALPLSIAVVGIATILAVASVFLVKRKRRKATLKAEASMGTTPKSMPRDDPDKVSTPSETTGSDSRSASKAGQFSPHSA